MIDLNLKFWVRPKGSKIDDWIVECDPCKRMFKHVDFNKFVGHYLKEH